MTKTVTYDKLYNDMANCFSVNKEGVDYKLGDYMLMKARAKSAVSAKSADEKNKNLPVFARTQVGGAISSVFSFINKKLTVKEAPVRDKTIRNFPLRASLTAMCSALVVCAMVISYGIIGAKLTDSTKATTYDDHSITETYEGECEIFTETVI